MADADCAAYGYTELLRGLYRAKQAQARGEVWGKEAVERWEQAVERFAERWGIGRG